MLATQVQYLNFLEQRRHNEAMEQEQYRSNRRNEFLKFRDLENQAAKYSADIKQNAQRIANERWQMERKTEIDRINASTNRMNAINQNRRNFQDWNLGLQANRIAEENARINRINAQSKETEAESKMMTAEVAQGRLTLDSGVNWMNAFTNEKNMLLRRRELDIMQQHYQWADTASMINSTANVANAIFRGVGALESASNLGFAMGRLGM